MDILPNAVSSISVYVNGRQVSYNDIYINLILYVILCYQQFKIENPDPEKKLLFFLRNDCIHTFYN